ncbi:MAG: hypothetical protein KKB31_01455, partial [Nanoarchaeota archaeon]|nr:hypothetical protein [Nanoarchaeota archaeon]
YYSSMVLFNVLASLEINVSDCENKKFNESQQSWCVVNISTKGNEDRINISTLGILRNYAAGQAGVVNTSFFYGDNETTTSNFFKQVNITLNATKLEIGNWTVNFTVFDLNYSQNWTSKINITVNRNTTLNDVPDYIKPSNLVRSISLHTVINLSVYDDDLLIPDKNISYGGFNETITFGLSILNATDLSVETLSNFTLTTVSSPVAGTNRTWARIKFTADATDVGNYTINITATDADGAVDFETFNLSILNNDAPYWNSVNSTLFLIEDTLFFSNFSRNVTDDNGDTLTFSFTNDTSFASFSINSTTGIVSFTPNDYDVGNHLVSITINDSYLTATQVFNFSVLNINDSLNIQPLVLQNATPSTPLANGGTMTATEDNITLITLFVEDDDLKIPTAQLNKGFYNETFYINLTIEGNQTLFDNFTLGDRNFEDNKSQYIVTFTPRKLNVGSYNVSINVSDRSGNSDLFTFNLTINSINHDPSLSSLSNQSTAVNRTLFYNINVTDIEDGNDTSSSLNTNFTFNYSYLGDGKTGTFLNSTTFNSSIGTINVTFNNSDGGAYHLNITVNDSTDRMVFDDFWIYVYDVPSVSVPSSGAMYNLTENTTALLNFTVNHSVGDNLTYEFYVDMIGNGSDFDYGDLVLRNLTSYLGNGSTYSWSFTPNFSDESYGKLKNLTLVVYPNSSDLSNARVLNQTINFKLNISHTNYPIYIYDQIDNPSPVSYTSSIVINLEDHFTDLDYDDPYYNQTPTFTITSNGTTITKTISSGWTLTLSSASVTKEIMSVTGSDTATTNDTTQNFTVSFTEPDPGSSSSSSSTSSGGGTQQVPVSLKILVPDPISAFQKDRIVVPITLKNDGSTNLYGVTLNGSVTQNETPTEDIVLEFSQTQWSGLFRGEEKKLNLTMIIDTDFLGLFEISLNATVVNPKFNDWGKIFLNIQEGESIREKLLFTEEFLVDNPQCAELTELLEEADSLLREGKSSEALAKADEALAACKKILAQAGIPGVRSIIENKLYRYLVFVTLGAFLAGIGYYSYKRMKLRRKQGSFVQEEIKNKKYLEL